METETKELVKVCQTTEQEVVDPDEMGADIVVYSLGWKGDQPAGAEKPNALVHSRVFVNGKELPYAFGLRVHAAGGDFTTAEIEVHPSSIRFIALDPETFKLADPERSTDAGL